MLSDGESVTKDDANILCAFHQGWVAELDHPGKFSKNLHTVPVNRLVGFRAIQISRLDKRDF